MGVAPPASLHRTQGLLNPLPVLAGFASIASALYFLVFLVSHRALLPHSAAVPSSITDHPTSDDSQCSRLLLAQVFISPAAHAPWTEKHWPGLQYSKAKCVLSSPTSQQQPLHLLLQTGQQDPAPLQDASLADADPGQLLGGCLRGRITASGFSAAQQLGSDLRRRYVEQHQLLQPQLSELVRARTEPLQADVRTLQAVLAGLNPASLPPVSINRSTIGHELAGMPGSCGALSVLTSRLQQLQSQHDASDQQLRDLADVILESLMLPAAQASSAGGAPPELAAAQQRRALLAAAAQNVLGPAPSPDLHWDQLREELACSAAANNNRPPLSARLMSIIDGIATQRRLQVLAPDPSNCQASQADCQQAVRLAIGTTLHDLTANMDAAVASATAGTSVSTAQSYSRASNKWSDGHSGEQQLCSRDEQSRSELAERGWQGSAVSADDDGPRQSESSSSHAGSGTGHHQTAADGNGAAAGDGSSSSRSSRRGWWWWQKSSGRSSTADADASNSRDSAAAVGSQASSSHAPQKGAVSWHWGDAAATDDGDDGDAALAVRGGDGRWPQRQQKQQQQRPTFEAAWTAEVDEGRLGNDDNDDGTAGADGTVDDDAAGLLAGDADDGYTDYGSHARAPVTAGSGGRRSSLSSHASSGPAGGQHGQSSTGSNSRGSVTAGGRRRCGLGSLGGSSRGPADGGRHSSRAAASGSAAGEPEGFGSRQHGHQQQPATAVAAGGSQVQLQQRQWTQQLLQRAADRNAAAERPLTVAAAAQAAAAAAGAGTVGRKAAAGNISSRSSSTTPARKLLLFDAGRHCRKGGHATGGLQQGQHADQQQPKLILHSVQDTTLMLLLRAVGVRLQHWPPFGSFVGFELWQQGGGHFFVRVLFNGEPVLFRLTGSKLLHAALPAGFAGSHGKSGGSPQGGGRRSVVALSDLKQRAFNELSITNEELQRQCSAPDAA